MTLRDQIRENPQVITSITLALIGVVLVTMGYQLLSHYRHQEPPVPKAFYTVDDGATLFADLPSRVPPFAMGSRTAVRAMVFTCDDGHTRFVGYLLRYGSETPNSIPERDLNPVPALPFDPPGKPTLQAKRPGQSVWVPETDTPRYHQVIDITCPDDPARKPRPVFPP